MKSEIRKNSCKNCRKRKMTQRELTELDRKCNELMIHNRNLKFNFNVLLANMIRSKETKTIMYVFMNKNSVKPTNNCCNLSQSTNKFKHLLCVK